MRFQSQPGKCGAASVRNALACFGRSIPDRRIRVETDENGDTHLSLIAAIREWGFTATEYTGQSASEAFRWLKACLHEGRPVIICVDDLGHWICVIGILGDRVNVFDSSNTVANMRECGVHVMSKVALKRRWRGWYGIAVGRG